MKEDEPLFVEMEGIDPPAPEINCWEDFFSVKGSLLIPGVVMDLLKNHKAISLYLDLMSKCGFKKNVIMVERLSHIVGKDFKKALKELQLVREELNGKSFITIKKLPTECGWMVVLNDIFEECKRHEDKIEL